MSKWIEDLGKELTLLLGHFTKETEKAKPDSQKPKTDSQKKPLTIREVGLFRLFIMLLAGIALLLLTFPDLFSGTSTSAPVSEESQKESTQISYEDADEYIKDAEERLKTLLKKVEGVGDVEVMITLKSSGESIPLKDTPYEKSSHVSEDETGETTKETEEKAEEETVMVEASDGTTQPYLVRETVPEIEGVAVIAQGGGNSEIKKEIVEAVQVLFDIKAHKIKVMKMNS
jgi:stage III sporulation protein AG